MEQGLDLFLIVNGIFLCLLAVIYWLIRRHNSVVESYNDLVDENVRLAERVKRAEGIIDELVEQEVLERVVPPRPRFRPILVWSRDH